MTEAETIVRQIKRWKSDILAFVKEVIHAHPTPQQAQVLNAFALEGARVTVRSGHGTGKSALLSWIIIWGICCFPDCKIPCTAPTANQLDNTLWGEVRKWAGGMNSEWRKYIAFGGDKVSNVETGSYAVKRTSRPDNPDALQGFHAKHLFFIIDEASGVADAVFEVARGALSTAGSRIILIGNPTRNAGFFWTSHCGLASENWTRIKLSCEDAPREVVSEKYLEEMRAEYGADSDIYRVRVLGEFPASGITQLIGNEVARAAAMRSMNPNSYAHAPVVLGVDVSYFGDDRSVIFRRQGLASSMLYCGRDVSTVNLAGLCAQFAERDDAQAIFVDATGVGAGVVDALRNMTCRDVYPVTFAGKGNPDKGTAFRNKRSECWWRMKQWLEEGGAIPNDEKLIGELCAPEYSFGNNGEVALERKEDVKKRLGASPDLADALALTFAHPVAPKARTTARACVHREEDLLAF